MAISGEEMFDQRKCTGSKIAKQFAETNNKIKTHEAIALTFLLLFLLSLSAEASEGGKKSKGITGKTGIL